MMSEFIFFERHSITIPPPANPAVIAERRKRKARLRLRQRGITVTESRTPV
jgi:hypothetical protein